MSKYKVIKPAKRCPKCNSITKYERKAYFCDNCDKLMSEDLGKGELRTSFWKNDHKSEDYYFCSWGCLREWINKNRKRFGSKDFYFFTLPYVEPENQSEFFKEFMRRPRA